VPQVGPSVAADLYTVGRTLAVLSFDFAGFSSRYADRLPARADVPVLAEHESYHRLLVRATHSDPGRRFESAAEMGEQLYGVLREVLSAGDGLARPAPSTLFTPERRAFGTGAGDLDGTAAGAMPVAVAVIAALPLPTVDPADPAAGYLATVGTTDPAGLAAALAAAPARSPEVRLRLVRGHVEAGDPAAARKELDALADDLPGDWRIDWYRGLAALAAADVSAARTSAFDAVYSALPGELAAQLALAVACEHAGDKAAASGYYQRVWRTDRSFVSAAFGLARHRFDGGDRSGAVAVLDQVPESSSYYLAAQVATVRVRLGAPPATLPEPDLLDAATRLERLELDVERQARLSVEMIHKALQWVLTRPPAGARQPPAAGRVLGLGLTERELRFGLERSYRALAKLSRDRQARAELVDLANAVRPRTLV
jgi:serine/threonine-protein kinase PknG